jgi:hypothetical protein
MVVSYVRSWTKVWRASVPPFRRRARASASCRHFGEMREQHVGQAHNMQTFRVHFKLNAHHIEPSPHGGFAGTVSQSEVETT